MLPEEIWWRTRSSNIFHLQRFRSSWYWLNIKLRNPPYFRACAILLFHLRLLLTGGIPF
jgi:hypothetical protein